MILLPAHQDGLVIILPVNVLWPTQETVLEVDQHVRTSAKEVMVKINIDVILQTIPVNNVRKEMLDVTQTEQLHVLDAKMVQIQLSSSNVTRLIQSNQNVRAAQRMTKKDALQEEQPVNNAHLRQNFMNVMKRLLPVFRLKIKETSSRHVLLNVDIRPLKNFLVPGEVSRQRKVKPRTSIWEKSI